MKSHPPKRTRFQFLARRAYSLAPQRQSVV